MIYKFHRTTRGAALGEYGLLTGLIAVLSITAISIMGDKTSQAFELVANETSAAMPQPIENPLPAPIGTYEITADTERGSNYTLSGWATPLLNGGTQLGSLNRSTPNSPINMRYMHQFFDAGHSYSYLNFEGDQRSALTGMTWICNDGTTLPVSEASVFSYDAGADYTSLGWAGNATAPMVAGQTYSCDLQAR